MGKPVKITVVGAGSATFSMGLVKDLCLTENLAGSTVHFMDIDADRLGMIHNMAERYNTELGGALKFESTTDLTDSLREADFCINTAGLEYGHWEDSREIFKRHGYHSGASFGFGHKNFALMMGVARTMEEICPDAWLIQSGNPVYDGTTLMCRQTSLNIIGLCHGHYGYKNIAQVLGLDEAKVRWVAPGLNHLIWLQEFRYEGENAYPILDHWLETEAEAYWADREAHPENYGLEDQMSRAVMDQYRRFGLLPVGDTTRDGGWWYNTDTPTRVHWYGPTGGFASDLHLPPFFKRHYARIEEIRKVQEDPTASVLAAFPPVKTHEQQVPIIDALTNDVTGLFQINVPNQGAVPGIPDDVAAEMPALIDMGGIHRIQCQPLPKKIMLEVILPRINAMEWGLHAYLTGDRDMVLDGMLQVQHFQSHGLTTSYAQAKAYMEDVLAQPWNQDLVERYPDRRPSWAHLLERRD